MIADVANFFTTTTIGYLIAVVVIICTYFKWSFQYWERKGVPFIQPTIPFGSNDNPFWRRRNLGTIIKDIYNELKTRGVKFGGAYMITRPVLVTVDPEIARHVLTKDFRCVCLFSVVSLQVHLCR